jgi:hypothetical protein
VIREGLTASREAARPGPWLIGSRVDRLDENAPSGYFPSTRVMLPTMLAAVDTAVPHFAFGAAPLTQV